MKIGRVIRDARKQAKLTQIELANRIDIAVNSLRLYEGDKRIPNAKTLGAIAAATGCDINLFFDLGEWDEVLAPLSKQSGDYPAYELIACELDIDPETVKSIIDSGEDSLLSQKLKYVARQIDEDFRHPSKNHDEDRTIDLGSDTVIRASDGSFITVSSNTEEAHLLSNFSILNEAGKNKAIERIAELTEIPKYRADSKAER